VSVPTSDIDAGGIDLAAAAAAAERAAERARREILPRFRAVEVETKADGSPVTEADRAAESAIRDELGRAFPDFDVLGEEYGGSADREGPTWIIDPIDGTIAFSRGLPLFTTLIALCIGDEPVLGLIDVPALGERYVGWRGSGCRRNGQLVRVSRRADLASAIVSHGDPFCFERAGRRAGFERMARQIPMLRGYTDAFGHAMVLSGAVDVMADFDLKAWDAAATRVLVHEAGGACHVIPGPPEREGTLGLVLGSPPLCDALLEMLEA